ncbi:MAG: hypothetical protein P2A85_09140 [Microcoleus anatoxicus]|uniref:hypothetical protein n=1 Tax=Microcoleus anatoxicus TaxID=2705319 RepID=UPI00366B8F65
MSISVSTKDNFYALYLNESVVANDRIVWQELVLISNDDTITCYGVLSADSLGLVNYKDKTWYPNGKKAVLKVNGSQEKDAWDKEESKFKKIPTPKDELLLYKLLRKAVEQHPQTHFVGHISPWLNPFYWEFLEEDANSPRAHKMHDDLVRLSPCTQTLLTQSEIDVFTASMPKAKSYGGFKGETESSRIKARMDFLTLQMADVAQFRDLYDLACQIVMASESSEHLTPIKILELSIAKTLELTAIILGA